MKKILLFLLFISIAKLQAQENLSTSASFFQNTTSQYQRWLDATGIGQILKVDKVKLKPNATDLELFLLLNTNDVDVAVAQWKALRKKIAVPTDSFFLEKMLFETFIRQMQIPDNQGNVQVYVKDANGVLIPCFYIAIWSEDGKISVDTRYNICKAKPLDVSVTLPAMKAKKGKTTVSNQTLNSSQVFNKIQRYAREQFEKTVCYDRYPNVEVDYNKSKGNTLVFAVTDLCRVVLKDENKSLWCKTAEYFGVKCNDIRRERLIFTFNYEATTNGYRLTGEVQGLFGSGVYKPRISGYMDMEPDFNDYLTSYANDFQIKLKTYLEQQ